MRTSWSVVGALALALAACGEPAGQRVAFDPVATEPGTPATAAPTGGAGESEPPPTVGSSQVTPGPAAPPAEPTPSPTPDGPRELGADEDAEIGRPYRYRLLTHCGIEHTWWNGAWWNADPPQSDGNGNPPPGWGNPFQDGVIVQVSQTRLEFTGDEGQRAAFTPRPAADGAPPPCD